MIHFQNIVIQSKDDYIDWRPFIHFIDEEGNSWELRGYGMTPDEAAKDAWANYQDKENWEVHGYIIERKKK